MREPSLPLELSYLPDASGLDHSAGADDEDDHSQSQHSADTDDDPDVARGGGRRRLGNREGGLRYGEDGSRNRSSRRDGYLRRSRDDDGRL